MMLHGSTKLLVFVGSLCMFGCTDIGMIPDECPPMSQRDQEWLGDLTSDVVQSVLRLDGTVWSWGYGSTGLLGNGSKLSSDVPVQALNLQDVLSIDQENGAAVAVDKRGDVWFWGNVEAYLGPPGIDTDVVAPKRVSHLGGAVAITINLVTIYLLKADGTVWYEKLDFYNPVVIEGPLRVESVCDVLVISKGLAVTDAGRIYDLNNRRFLQDSLRDVIAVTGDPTRHILALKRDGTAVGWGNNDLGQLGNGTFTNSNIPVAVMSLTDVAQVSANADYSLALKKDGSVWFWGFEGRAGEQLIGRNVPVEIVGLTNVVLISAGYVCLAMKRDGTYWSINVESKMPKQVTFE